MRKNSLKIAGVYTAVVLGAGFASGQELMKFFVQYGVAGVWGIMLSGVVFAITGWAVLDICRREKIESYALFMNRVMGRTGGLIMEVVVALFLCILFFTMLAGGGATLQEAFGLPYTAGVVLVGLLCFVALLFDMEGMVEINTVLAPFMVVGGLFLGLYSFFNQDVEVFMLQNPIPPWMVSAWVHSSYNIITAVSVLCAMGGMVDRKKTAFLGGVLGGLAITALGIAMSIPIFLHYTGLVHYEIPILQVMRAYGPGLTYFYLLILLAAIYTTAVSSGFAAVQWLTDRFKVNRMALKVGLVLVAMLCAHGGFSNFVGRVYPVFGYVGFFEILVILLYWLRKR